MTTPASPSAPTPAGDRHHSAAADATTPVLTFEDRLRLYWTQNGQTVMIGVGLVLIDETLRARTAKMSLPPLGAALAMYLPTEVTTPVVLGAVIGWAYDRWMATKPWGSTGKRLSVLLASGMIVGESLVAVVLAGLSIATNKEAPLAVFGDNPTHGFSELIGAVGCIGGLAALYVWVGRLARETTAKP